MRQTLSLAGLVMLLMLATAGVGLFALDRSRADQIAAAHGLGLLTEQRDAARRIGVQFKVQVQEWKNILLRGYDPAQRERYQAAFRTRREEVATELAALGAVATPLAAEHAALGRAYDEALAGATLDSLEGIRAADAGVRGADRALQDGLDGLAEFLAIQHRVATASAETHLEDRYAETRQLVVAMAGSGLFVTLVLLGLLARRRA